MKVVPTWCPQQCCFAFGMAPHFGVIVLGLFSLLYGGNTMGRLLTSCLVFSTEAGLLRCLIVLEGNHRRRHVVAETFHFFFSATFWKKKNRSVVVFLVICPEGKVTSLFWKDGPRCEALLGASVVSCRKRLQLIVRADCGNIQGHWVVRGVICSVLVWLPFLFFTAMRIVFVNAFFFSSFAADVFLSVQTEYIWNSCTFMPLLCRDVHVN